MSDVMYDQGGVLPVGLTTVVNHSGVDEPLYRWAHLGQLGGIPVVVSPNLPETSIYRGKGVVICGRLSHLQYTLAVAQARVDARRDLKKMLDSFAARWGIDR